MLEAGSGGMSNMFAIVTRGLEKEKPHSFNSENHVEQLKLDSKLFSYLHNWEVYHAFDQSGGGVDRGWRSPLAGE
jgi:hypothetical protein